MNHQNATRLCVLLIGTALACTGTDSSGEDVNGPAGGKGDELTPDKVPDQREEAYIDLLADQLEDFSNITRLVAWDEVPAVVRDSAQQYADGYIDLLKSEGWGSSFESADLYQDQTFAFAIDDEPFGYAFKLYVVNHYGYEEMGPVLYYDVEGDLISVKGGGMGLIIEFVDQSWRGPPTEE